MSRTRKASQKILENKATTEAIERSKKRQKTVKTVEPEDPPPSDKDEEMDIADMDDPDLASPTHIQEPNATKTPIPRKSSFTLQKCLEIIRGLANPESTKEIYNRCLTNLAIYASAVPSLYSDLTAPEASHKLKDFDLGKLIRDFAKTVDVIENKSFNRKTGQPLALETKAQFYKTIVRLFGKGTGKFEVEKALKDNYFNKVYEYDKAGNAVRDQNAPKRGVADHPDISWEDALARYTDYLDTESMTNTKTGNHRLRIATILGFYILQRPRRVQDYQLLQLYHKYPATHPKDKNILVMEKDKATIYLDKFKTRWSTRGSTNKRGEVLPLYKKELNPRLVSLLKDYIKRFDVKDKQYVFFPEGANHDEPYSDKSFGTAITSSLAQIMKPLLKTKKNLGGVNTLRHWFNTYVTEHYNEYTDAQRKEIALDVGDTPRNPSTNLRYTIANQGNKGKTVTEIQGEVFDREKAKEQAILEAEEEGSVGEVDQPMLDAPRVDDFDDLEPRGGESVAQLLDGAYSAIRPWLIKLLEASRG